MKLLVCVFAEIKALGEGGGGGGGEVSVPSIIKGVSI